MIAHTRDRNSPHGPGLLGEAAWSNLHMKKKNKFGVNTGNTISYGTNYSFIRRHNGEQNVVVKSLVNKHIQPVNFSELNERIVNEVTSMVNDGEIDGTINYIFPSHRFWSRRQDDVVYSMNKRKRWTLKDRILKSIENLREQGESNETKPEGTPFSISLTERSITPHWLYWEDRYPDCTAYHSHVTSAYPSSKYSCETDLKNKANSEPMVDKRKEKKEKRRKGHNQHFRDLQRPRNEFGKKKRKQKAHEEQNNQRWLFQAHPIGQERQAENQTPEIHYEICTPRPLIAHHKYYDSQSESWGRFDYRPWCKSRNKCKHFKNKAYYTITGYGKKQLIDIVKYKTTTDEEWYEESETNFKLYENILENEETVAENVHNEPQNCIDFSHVFDKVEKDRNNNNRLKQNNPNKHQKQLKSTYTGIHSGIANCTSSCPLKHYGKGKTIYEPQIYGNTNYNTHNEPSITTEDPIVSTFEKTLAPLSIKIDPETLCPKFLESVYKDAYMEGCSVPRSFIINLSIYKCQMLQMEENQEESVLCDPCDIGGVYAVFKETAKPVDVLCVNTHSSEEFVNVSKFKTVGLNIEGDFTSMKKLGIQQRLAQCMKDHTVITLKQTTDLILKTMQEKYLQDVKTRGMYRRREKSLYETFITMHKWDLKFYDPEESYHIVKDLPMVGHKKKLKKHGSVSVVHRCLDDDTLCDICLTSTNTDIQGIVNGTSLLSCHHWFCNDCWREHLLQGISNGVKILECPGYECNSVVDGITLMSLLGYTMYEKHWRQVQSSKLDCSPQWNWCPSVTCNQIVQAQLPSTQDPSEKKVCVDCVCNHTWCFDCQLEPHWPLSCHMADTYFKLVEQKGLDKYNAGKLHYVEVKRCKQCKQAIEKNGGCQHMYCRCGFRFCWECLQSWASHMPSLHCPSSTVELSRYRLDDFVDVLQKEQYFNLAVDFRQQKRFKEDRLKGRILTAIKNNQRSQTTNRKQYINNLYSDIAKINDNEYYRKIRNMAGYLFQIYHFLEFSYVFMSQIGPKQRKRLTDNLLIMSLLAKQLSKLLYEDKINSVADLTEKFDSIHGVSLTRLKMIAKIIHQIQEKLEK